MLIKGVFIFIIMLILVSYLIRKIIYISFEKHLLDEPGEDRKIHLLRTPNLGGVAIFVSMLFSSIIIFSWAPIPHLNFIFFSALVLFIIGLTDDILGVDPLKKMAAQVSIALLITLFTNLRITGFYGLFGIHEIPFTLSIILTTLFIIFIINAFNLIDGINCLAGSIGLLASLFFAVYFWRMEENGFMLLSMAMCGCLGGFLGYNRTPARIFMGDTGSLFIGFIIALLSIRFLELNNSNAATNPIAFLQYAPAILMAFLIIPVHDTLRVFTLRILKRKSPFIADRNHIHHMLIDLGLTHLAATGVLLTVTFISIVFAFLLRTFRLEIIFTCMGAFTLILNWILHTKYSKKCVAIEALRNSYIKPKLIIVRDKVNVEKV